MFVGNQGADTIDGITQSSADDVPINEALEDVRDVGRRPGAHCCADQLLVELGIKLKYVVFEYEV